MPPDERATPAELPPAWRDALGRAGLREGLASRVLFFETASSTNDIATTIAASGEGRGLAVIAETQTRGRGRQGRQWFSPPGSGLYVSLVVTPGEAAADPERATRLVTLMAGVALAEAIEAVTGLGPAIKWPNDLLIGSRKLAGILAETVNVEVRLKPDPTYDLRQPEGESLRSAIRLRSGRPERSRGTRPRDHDCSVGARGAPREGMSVILGYGINVGRAAYPPELATRATSLEHELGRAIDRAELGAATLASIGARYGDLMAGRFDAILDAWRARAIGQRGARVAWETLEGPRAGVTEGIDDRGALIVNTERGPERLVAGEVRWDCF
jgi:BirA family biotin operon repressor/biotin-[acetyl-CoA-carboxylase] ligase